MVLVEGDLTQLLSLWVFPIAAVLIFVATTIYTWRIHKNLFSPPTIFAAGWLLPATLTAIPHEFPYKLRLIAWVAVFLSFASFMCGYLLAVRVKPNNHQNTLEEIEKFETWKRLHFRLILAGIFILFFSGFAFNLIHLISEVGPKAYFVLPYSEIERIFGGASPISNYLYFLNGLLIALSVVYAVAFRIDFFIIIVAGVSLVSTPFFGHKSAIIRPVILAIAAYYSSHLRSDIRPLLILVPIVPVTFGLVFYSGTDGWLNLATLYNNIDVLFDRILMYIAPNYANLQENIISQTQLTGGLHTISPLVKLITLETVIISLPAAELVNPDYNMGTFALSYYLDYGWLGFVIPPFMIGTLSTWVYTWLLDKPTVESIIIYSIVISMNIFVFFGNSYNRIQYWFYITIIVFVLLVRKLLGSGNRNPRL